MLSAIEDTGDREFMLKLYETHKGLMMATALRYTSERTAAEDIVHDGVVKLIEKVPLLRSMEPQVLTGYIAAAIRNTAISYLRSQGTVQRHRTTLNEEAWDETALTLDELAELTEHREALIRAWPRLREEDRFVLEGKYLLELSDRELAQRLGCEESSVRMKLTRARRRAYQLATEKEDGT